MCAVIKHTCLHEQQEIAEKVVPTFIDCRGIAILPTKVPLSMDNFVPHYEEKVFKIFKTPKNENLVKQDRDSP